MNAYCEPLITLDCDVVVVASRQTELEQALRGLCKMERYAHRLNIIAKGSKVRIQIQTDAHLQDFLACSRVKTVLERRLRVASREDLIVSKAAAYQDPTRRRTKREKDRLDILRLVENYSQLKKLVPLDLQKEFQLK